MKFICSTLLVSSSLAAPLLFESEETFPQRRLSEQMSHVTSIPTMTNTMQVVEDTFLDKDDVDIEIDPLLAEAIEGMTNDDWNDFFDLLSEEFMEAFGNDSRNIEDLSNEEFETLFEKIILDDAENNEMNTA